MCLVSPIGMLGCRPDWVRGRGGGDRLHHQWWICRQGKSQTDVTRRWDGVVVDLSLVFGSNPIAV